MDEQDLKLIWLGDFSPVDVKNIGAAIFIYELSEIATVSKYMTVFNLYKCAYQSKVSNDIITSAPLFARLVVG